MISQMPLFQLCIFLFLLFISAFLHSPFTLNTGSTDCPDSAPFLKYKWQSALKFPGLVLFKINLETGPASIYTLMCTENKKLYNNIEKLMNLHQKQIMKVTMTYIYIQYSYMLLFPNPVSKL